MTDNRPAKVVEANQKAVDALPFNSGTWSVEGVPGLFLRSRAATKSYYVQRRVDGTLIKDTLGQMPVKQAKDAAMKQWGRIAPKPARVVGVKTLAVALEEYFRDKRKLSETTRRNYQYNFDSHLKHWADLSLEDIGHDRAGMRRLQRTITEK